ncbi:hypothetical protein QL285_040928 [Trifolium repens]|nr:hypothetical protein QL285_040928 [Trifolium repens]
MYGSAMDQISRRLASFRNPAHEGLLTNAALDVPVAPAGEGAQAQVPGQGAPPIEVQAEVPDQGAPPIEAQAGVPGQVKMHHQLKRKLRFQVKSRCIIS